MKSKIKILIYFITFSILLICSIAYGINDILYSQVSQPSYLLVVTGSGSGSGTITSYGINCTSTAGVESGSCSALVPMGTTVTLTATATAGIFNGWTGAGCGGAAICSVLINGNVSVDASFVLIPQQANLLAWYKVNEGSGATIVNYAPASANKFADLNVVTPGTNFWGTYSGFGYWDGSTTTVNRGFGPVNPFGVFPYGPGQGYITIIGFGRNEAPQLAGAVIRQILQIRTGRACFFGHNVRSPASNDILAIGGMVSTSAAYVQYTPYGTYINRRFWWSIRSDQTTTLLWHRMTDPIEAIKTNSIAEQGSNDPVNLVAMGYDSITPTANETWKGILGDVLVWNVRITDAEVNQVIAALGARWGF
jgi:hypothetical protein